MDTNADGETFERITLPYENKVRRRREQQGRVLAAHIEGDRRRRAPDAALARNAARAALRMGS